MLDLKKMDEMDLLCEEKDLEEWLSVANMLPVKDKQSPLKSSQSFFPKSKLLLCRDRDQLRSMKSFRRILIG